MDLEMSAPTDFAVSKPYDPAVETRLVRDDDLHYDFVDFEIVDHALAAAAVYQGLDELAELTQVQYQAYQALVPVEPTVDEILEVYGTWEDALDEASSAFNQIGKNGLIDERIVSRLGPDHVAFHRAELIRQRLVARQDWIQADLDRRLADVKDLSEADRQLIEETEDVKATRTELALWALARCAWQGQVEVERLTEGDYLIWSAENGDGWSVRELADLYGSFEAAACEARIFWAFADDGVEEVPLDALVGYRKVKRDEAAAERARTASTGQPVKLILSCEAVTQQEMDVETGRVRERIVDTRRDRGTFYAVFADGHQETWDLSRPDEIPAEIKTLWEASAANVTPIPAS